jgi:type IV secretory pathway VirB6-like protein
MSRFLTFLCVLGALLAISLPQTAHAAPYDIDECNYANGVAVDAGQYTQKVVNCLELTIMNSIDTMLFELSEYMTPVVELMIVLSIIIFGARIASGERNLTRRAASFLIRLGLVWMFSYKLGETTSSDGFAQDIYTVMHDLICTVSFTPNGCYNPWEQLDGVVGRFLGFGTSISIISGLLGIISSAIFSPTLGFVLFMVGVKALLDIAFFVLRIVFTYLTAIVVIGFLIIISPLIIPLALFYATEIYFRRWLDVLLSAMLTPILLFAFLQLFLGIFDNIINEKILAMFSCDNADASTACDFSAYTKINEPLFSWMLPADSNFVRSIEATTHAQAPSIPVVQSYIDATARRAQNLGISTPSVDFGPMDIAVWQQLIYGLVLLILYTTLMKSMIRNIPDIANNIAGAVSGIQIQTSSFEPAVNQAVDKAKNLFAPGGRP